MCTAEDVFTVRSACVDGEQNITTATLTDECRGAAHHTTKVSCGSSLSVESWFAAVVAVAVVVFTIAAVAAVTYFAVRHRRLHREYKKLLGADGDSTDTADTADSST